MTNFKVGQIVFDTYNKKQVTITNISKSGRHIQVTDGEKEYPTNWNWLELLENTGK